MSDPTYVRLRDIAEEYGSSPMQGRASRWYKACEVLGIEVFEGRKTSSRPPLMILETDVSRLVDYVTSPVELVGEEEIDDSPTGIGNHVVYVIVLDPDKPTRVKIGRTDRISSRLRELHYLCPDAYVHASYAVPPSCESYALALARSLGESRATELFDFPDVNTLKRYLSVLESALSPIVEHYSSE